MQLTSARQTREHCTENTENQ